MANLDTTIILGGVVLPFYSELKETTKPNETDIVTLGGNLYTDFINNRREWVVSWENLKREDFDIIYALYTRQYQQSSYLMLQIDAYNIYIPAKINISQKDIKWNGSIYKNFSITLKEQLPFS